MNFLLVLLIVLFVLSLTDFMRPNDPKFHAPFYHLAFLLAVFFFSIKYYYGPDIYWYVPLYDNIASIQDLLQGAPFDSSYELGFTLFLTLCKSLGLSYWAMTLVVNLLYFGVLYTLFKRYSIQNVLALLLVILLDYNLIFAQHRQCLAVSFFILMYLSYHKRHFGRMTLFMLLTILCHKSGLFVAVISYGLLLLNFRVTSNSYSVVALFALLFFFIPIHSIIIFIAQSFSMDEAIISSLEFHFGYAKRIQSILLVYAIIFFCFSVYKTNNKTVREADAITFLGAIFIALFYSYFPILGRIKSYFTPFFIPFIFFALNNQYNENEIQISSARNKSLFFSLRPIIFVLLLLYSLYCIQANYKNQNLYASKIYESSTIFQRFTKSKEEIVEQQIAKAHQFWYFENYQEIQQFQVNE